MLFPIGQLVATSGIDNKMDEDEEFKKFVFQSLKKHVQGDWGELCQEDMEQNILALKEKNRLLSVYEKEGTKIWIITEWDRSATTILFPDEY